MSIIWLETTERSADYSWSGSCFW